MSVSVHTKAPCVLELRIQKMSAQKIQARGADIPKSTLQLPCWSDTARGMPNAWLRSAIFAAIQAKTRRLLKREFIATIDGVEIRMSGWQLEQSDADVWGVFLHLARRQPIGNRILLREIQILKELVRSTGTNDRKWLKAAFVRLAGAAIEMKFNGQTIVGAMLKGGWDERANMYLVEIEPHIYTLYMAGWTQVNWEERVRLRRKPLSLWLHGWFSSHAKPFSLCIETIQQLSGCANPHPGSFNRQLAKALNDLVSVGALVSWTFNGHLVSVVRLPSSSQKRHLAKRKRGDRACG